MSLDPARFPVSPKANDTKVDVLKETTKAVVTAGVANQKHYTSFAIQPHTFIVANNLNWFQGNCLKYLTRGPLKNGIQDIRKMIDYGFKWIQYLEGDPTWWDLKRETVEGSLP